MKFAGIIIAIAGIMFSLAIPEFWEGAKIALNQIHPNLSHIILIVTVTIGGLVYVIDNKKRRVEKSEISKISYQKIYTELKDGLDSLDGTLDRKTMQYEINGKNMNYKHIYMNRKVFDGLVNSGDFNLIDHELQQSLQDIYGKIEIHDDHVKKIVELEDNSSLEEKYVLILNEYEKELLNEIPSMMEKIKKILDK